MKWISVRDSLPPTHEHVLVCRIIKVMDFEIQSHDIGMLLGTGRYDRWELQSQQFSPLPTKPTLDSGIITHWMKLPKYPPKEDAGQE